MPLGSRHGRYGPSTGGPSRDLDNLYREVGNIRKQVSDMQDNADMAQASNVSAAASPGSPFATRSKTKKGGEIDRLVININKNTTSVKVELIAMPDNTGTDPTLAHSKVIEFEYKDITEEEQMAGFIQRESPLLQFLTTYRLTRLVASVLKDDGTTAVAKNPSTSPYKSAPPFTGLMVDFTTCDSNGQNCSNSTTPITSITAGRMGVKWVDPSTDFKLTDSGVKVRMHFAIPKTLDTLRVVLIKASDPKAEAVDYIFQIDKTERDAGTLDRRFAVKLEYGITYNLVRLVGKGDNVGGTASDQDTVRIPADNQGPIPDVGNSNVSATFTTPTSAGVGDGSATLKILQNVTTPYRFKNKGVKGIFDLTFPANTDVLTVRIREGTDNNIGLEDTFSDFTSAEKTAGAATRQFGPLLDFVSPYTVTKMIATGPGIGGEGVSTVKNPLSGPGSLLTFGTPDSEGNAGTSGNVLDYISPVGATVTGRVTKRGGIIVKMTVTIPRNTRRVTVKIQNTRDNTSGDAGASVLEYSFEDITDAERSANSLTREFGIPLEANATYGVVRLIAEGDGVNSSFSGGNNPDVYRVPKTQPTSPFDYKINGTAKTFATLLSAGIGFGTTTVPSKPVSTDITTNTVDQDTEAPFVQLRIYASELRAANGQTGATGTNGEINFNDVGATGAIAIVNAVGDSNTAEHIKAGGPIADPTATFVDVEVPGLTFGKNYAWVRNILTNGTDGRAVAVAATAVSTGSSQLGIPFRAGGSTSIANLSLSVAPPALQDPRHSQVAVTVTNPSNAIFKNLVLTRDKRVASSPPGKGTDISSGYEEVGRLITRGDPTYATTFSYTFVVQHPRSVDISYIARAKGLKLDGADQTDKVSPATTYINTADETAVTDGAAPFYSSAVSANARIKWKPNHLRVRFDLPDQNMNTFQRVLLYSRIIGITGSSDLSWNPDTGDSSTTTFLAQDVYLGSLSPGAAVNTYVVDIGRGSHVNLACDKPRPNNKGDEFPQTAFNGLTTSTSVQVMVLIVNQAAITSPYASFTLFTTYTGDQNSIPPFWVSSSNGG